MKYEDFYPYSDTEALICCGDSYQKLSQIRKVYYELMPNGSIDFTLGEVIKSGGHLRLGNYYNDKLYYTDGYDKSGIVQNYMTDIGLFYQQDSKIYLDDDILLTHTDTSHPKYQIGRPSYQDDWVYFESRGHKKYFDTGIWEVWRYNVKSKQRQKLLDNAANPYVYKDKLFFSTWLNGAFVSNWCYIDDTLTSRLSTKNMNSHGKIIYSHINPNDTVLDLGCGILQEFGYKPPVGKYLGVDAFDPYLRKIADQGVMTVRGKLPDFCESFLDKSWDVVLLMDVIEHLTKEDGFKALDHVERIAKKCVIIDTPNGFIPQEGWDAWDLPHCDLQAHLSGWTDEEFRTRGYDTVLIGNRSLQAGEHVSVIATRYV